MIFIVKLYQICTQAGKKNESLPSLFTEYPLYAVLLNLPFFCQPSSSIFIENVTFFLSPPLPIFVDFWKPYPSLNKGCSQYSVPWWIPIFWGEREVEFFPTCKSIFLVILLSRFFSWRFDNIKYCNNSVFSDLLLESSFPSISKGYVALYGNTLIFYCIKESFGDCCL